MTSSDAKELQNSRLTLFVMMNCLNGFFQDVASDSLSESLMKAGHGGAVAVWASSGMTTPDGQTLIDQEFCRQSSDRNATIGEAIRNAKAATGDRDIRRTWILLGDPAMHVK